MENVVSKKFKKKNRQDYLDLQEYLKERGAIRLTYITGKDYAQIVYHMKNCSIIVDYISLFYSNSNEGDITIKVAGNSSFRKDLFKSLKDFVNK